MKTVRSSRIVSTLPVPKSLVLCELDETSLASHESFSPFCLKVHRALHLAGLTFTSKRGAPADTKQWNPAKQVPVLLVDGEAVFDSTAILERIEKMVPGSLTSGLDTEGRALAYTWEEFADTTLNAFVVLARWIDDSNWPLVRDAYFGKAPWFVRSLIAPRLREHVRGTLVARDVLKHGIENAWVRFEVILDQLETLAKAKSFWLGDAPTSADVAIFAQLHSLRTHLTVKQHRMIDARPLLSRWLDRVDAATRTHHISSTPVASNWSDAPVAAISSHSLPSLTNMTVP